MADGGAGMAVERNEGAERFETTVDGHRAILTYSENDGKLYLLHTEVPPELEGQGIGSALVKFAAEHARGAGMKVVPLCPFADTWFKRHRDYGELVARGD